MEWIFVLIIIVYIISKLRKYTTKNTNEEYEENDNEDLTYKIMISESIYSSLVPMKPNNYEWIPPGEAVSISGYDIPGGMIYIGKHMKSVTSPFLTEPGFINVNLPVDRSNPDRFGKNMNYWPCYSDIPPSSRAAFLEWLAGGRQEKHFNIGYIFLFFYGLERRLLYDTNKYKVNVDEIQKIIIEIERLLNIYGPMSSSFNQYAESLLEFKKLQYAPPKFYNLEPPSTQFTYEISPIIKLALGQLAKEGKPISAKWIYAYGMHHPEIYLKTPAKRCQKEFEKLFMIRYKKKFNEGILIKANNTKTKINYNPASSGLRSMVFYEIMDIPDVSVLKSPLNKIKPIIEECQDDLDKYSRWIGKNPEKKESIVALSMLPDELIDCGSNKEMENFKSWIFNRMKNDDMVVVDNKELIKWWTVKIPGKMNKSESNSFTSLLEKIGVGVEPDVRFNGAPIKEPGISVLFKLKETQLSELSTVYLGKTILMQLAATVAKADGIIAESEQSHLMEFIESFTQLNSAEKLRMKANLMWFFNSDTVIHGFKNRIDSIDQNQKKWLAGYLISVAGADGYISPEEVKMLIKLYNLLDMDKKEVYTNIHIFQAEKRDQIDEPVTVRPADDDKVSYSIPGPEKEQVFRLNMTKIKNKMQETDEVSIILSDVFKDDEPEEPDTNVEENEKPIPGIDDNHYKILIAFQKQKIWSRHEFEKIAAKYDLLPDGALDVLNEKSLEKCNEVLCEGEDPIEINQNVLEELIS